MEMNIFKAVLLLSVVAIVNSLENNSSKIKVSIYYESLCPDSVDFITSQFYPNYKPLKDNILMDFVPYGKASQNKDRSGNWEFRCQHGRNECKGNKYQACALDQKKGQDSDSKFVNCVMLLPDPSHTEGIQNCATNNLYDWSKITTCFEGDRGNELLAAYGDRTHNLNPKLRFVPTIILNDIYDRKIQTGCLYDFLKTICSRISGPKPDVCKS